MGHLASLLALSAQFSTATDRPCRSANYWSQEILGGFHGWSILCHQSG